MAAILLLCHRLPWPPSKGDKIRSYHVLRRLAAHHDVYLGTFIDDADDWRHVPAVQALCADTCVRPLGRWQTRVRALGALARGQALTVGCYRDRTLQDWVRNLLEQGRIDLALCYSSGTAPLVWHARDLPRVMDFVDADSDKWRQYAHARHGPARWLYAREARCLARWEQSVAKRFDASVFVSTAEADFFCQRAPSVRAKVHGIANGVDAAYWDPAKTYASPYPAGGPVIAFAGAMDYRANIDAVTWFARAVWPTIRTAQPQARFYIVGSHPANDVRALAAQPGIEVTGRVADVRPYLAHAHAVTAPLRIARGIQNKVLEAMAMEKVLLLTPEAWEGIEDFPGRAGCITRSAAAMAQAAAQWLPLAQPARIPSARAKVVADYAWDGNLDRYEAVLHETLGTAPLAAAMETGT